MNKSRILATYLWLSACGSNGNGRAPTPTTQIPGAVGSATLSWTIPIEREDESPLTNLAGFNVYMGIAAGLYTDEFKIDNPTVNIYIVEQLDPGTTYYFVVTAFDSDQLESDFSNEVSKTIE